MKAHSIYLLTFLASNCFLRFIYGQLNVMVLTFSLCSSAISSHVFCSKDKVTSKLFNT